MPPFLNPFQAIAWITWRDEDLAARIDNNHLLMAQRLYGSEALNGKEWDLQDALVQGAVSAMGRRGEGDFEPLPAIVWVSGRVRQPWTYKPYGELVFQWCDIVSLWPPIGLVERRGRPSPHDWDAVRTMAEAAITERPKIGRNRLADALVADYLDKVGSPAPDASTIRKRLKEWGIPRA